MIAALHEAKYKVVVAQMLIMYQLRYLVWLI